MKKTRLYVCGSHSVGKTTLCRELGKHLAYEVMPEAARDVLARQKLSLHDLDRDVCAKDQFQRDTFEEHMARHQSAIDLLESEGCEGVIFDRGIDYLVYAARYSTLAYNQFVQDETQAYLDALNHSEALVLLLEPDGKLIQEDGVRAALSMQTAKEITFGIKVLLEVFGISYIHVKEPDTLERVKLVTTIVEGA